MNIEDVLEAKNDQKKLGEIYKSIIFDKNGNHKLRNWLVKNGVNFNELSEVESSMNESFMEGFRDYNDDKIDFEKYVWTKFKHMLYNYFYSKNVTKKNADLYFESDIAVDRDNDDGNTFYDKLKIDLGNVSDVDMDLELLPRSMNHVQSLIFKCKVFSDYNDSEIFEAFPFYVDKEVFDMEYMNVRKIIQRYINGEL